MMIHEKIMSGQFLFDFKNDRSSLMHMHNQHSHHHHQSHTQSSAPPITASQLDIYSAYAYQQQLQQQLIGTHHNHHQNQSTSYSHEATVTPEVLDLSRRCDSVETPRKTPSPYQTTSSFGTCSPTCSPTSSQQYLEVQQIPGNLLFSSQAQHPQTGLRQATSLYSTPYYPTVKQEPSSPTPPVPAAAGSSPSIATSNLLHTFASAAAAVSAVSAMQVDLPASQSPVYTKRSSTTPTSSKAEDVTPTSTSTTQQQDSKVTRPFKAFPRDPLVIAANFAASDVLLDNPRVERYTEYRKRVLEQIRSSNGGARTVTNPKMRRTNSRNGSIHEGFSSNHNSESDERNAAEESSDCDSNAGNFEKLVSGTHSTLSDANHLSNGSQVKDAAYYERRRKNNAAAKKSRDRRRIKEDEIAIRAAYLERQNIELLCQIDALKTQLASFVSKASA